MVVCHPLDIAEYFIRACVTHLVARWSSALDKRLVLTGGAVNGIVMQEDQKEIGRLKMEFHTWQNMRLTGGDGNGVVLENTS